HLAGVIAAIPGLAVLLWMSREDTSKFVAMATYGLGLLAVFASSTAYHYFDIGPVGNRWLKRLDHTSIFLLIGGSYMPPLMHLLDGAWRIAMISVVAGLALAGVAFKLLWISAPKWLSVASYLFLGWVIVIPAPLILPQLTTNALICLLAGGACFTIGAFVYLFDRPSPWPGRFGAHEIWHLFVLAGAALHFAFAWTFLGTVAPAF
ncbi:MAG: hemolysin III family protein, partial [Myxococcales bacterium]|nr:hemolysin III family protein [Myxococcales bacterium]